MYERARNSRVVETPATFVMCKKVIGRARRRFAPSFTRSFLLPASDRVAASRRTRRRLILETGEPEDDDEREETADDGVDGDRNARALASAK